VFTQHDVDRISKEIKSIDEAKKGVTHEGV